MFDRPHKTALHNDTSSTRQKWIFHVAKPSLFVDISISIDVNSLPCRVNGFQEVGPHQHAGQLFEIGRGDISILFLCAIARFAFPNHYPQQNDDYGDENFQLFHIVYVLVNDKEFLGHQRVFSLMAGCFE